MVPVHDYDKRYAKAFTIAKIRTRGGGGGGGGGGSGTLRYFTY